MSEPAFIIGIDLGTTNCALAAAGVSGRSDPEVFDFPVTQLVLAGQVASRTLLPSCLYLPGEHELPAGSTQLPWGESPAQIAGEFARWQGAKVPGRLVASAKSWLCHPGVDRTADILPWGAQQGIVKISPVEASALLLRHLVSAWNNAHPDAPASSQEVVLTVPASFDEAARALTVIAAKRAGLDKVILVEEPQAAFHDFASNHRQDLKRVLSGVRMVLVADVGGGTTDFSLIQVSVDQNHEIVLNRIAVGEHLMLGGDNMDAALARRVEERITAGGRRLDAAQWHQLTQASRIAKEKLMGTESLQSHPIAIAGGGSRLIGSTLSASLDATEVRAILLSGFFPAVDPGASLPGRGGSRMALQELGLPYAQDPAITRHLLAFLTRHKAAGFAALGLGPESAGLPRPDAILLNGGVFNSKALADHFVELISGWWPGSSRIPLLDHGSLEVAVARGAVAHGLARRGVGRRIGGGSSHAFFVGLAQSKQGEIPQAICVIPKGHETVAAVELKERSFILTLGRPVQFPLYSNTSDHSGRAGDLVAITDDFHALPPTHTLLSGPANKVGTVPVHLRALLTELGTLELWCVADGSDDRWRLEFELRGNTSGGGSVSTESLPARFAEARALIERVFGNKTPPATVKDVRQLTRSLEAVLGSRESWSLPVLREIWALLFALAGRRRRTPDHERVYFQLLGYALRPGFGYPLDEWRCEQTFKLFSESVNFHSEHPNWNEFWVHWRRIAGGLGEERQRIIWNFLEPHLRRRIAAECNKPVQKPRGAQPEGLDEMVRVAASLEELFPGEKEQFGALLAEKLKVAETAKGPWCWALGRLGARSPLHGSTHKVVSREKAEEWLRILLGLDLRQLDGAMLAVVTLGRLTGDRSRDLEEEIRKEAASRIQLAGAPERWCRMLLEVVEMESADRAQSLGDSLPFGLKLQ